MTKDRPLTFKFHIKTFGKEAFETEEVIETFVGEIAV